MSNLEITIRPGRPEEAAVFRMLLPHATRGATDHLMATSAERPYVAGVATFVRLPEAMEAIAIHVVPTFRQRGVGSQLLRTILSLHASAKTAAGWIDVTTGDVAARFAAAQGFTCTDQLTSVECSALAACEYADRYRDWAMEKCRAKFNLLTLQVSDKTAVARLWREHLEASPYYRLDTVHEMLSEPQLADSPVLMRAGEVVGFMLTQRDADCVRVPVQVVAPSARREFGAVALDYALCDHLRQLGAKRIRFDWRPGVAYTPNLSQKLHGNVVQVMQRWVRQQSPVS